MNFETLSGVYQNARTVVRLLEGPSLYDRLGKLRDNERKRVELALTLEKLASHVRAMGFDEVVTVKIEK